MARYYIAFDTKEFEGAIKATYIDLGEEIVRDMNKPLPVNLCDQKLYPLLVAHVKSNPVRKAK